MITPSQADREEARRWLDEGQHRLQVVIDALNGYARLSERLKCAESENRHLRSENEHLRHWTKTLEQECERLLEEERRLREELRQGRQAREEVADRLGSLGAELIPLLRRRAETSTQAPRADPDATGAEAAGLVEVIGLLQKALQPTPQA